MLDLALDFSESPSPDSITNNEATLENLSITDLYDMINNNQKLIGEHTKQIKNHTAFIGVLTANINRCYEELSMRHNIHKDNISKACKGVKKTKHTKGKHKRNKEIITYYLQGMSVRDISKKCDISESTVYRVLRDYPLI